MSLVKGRPLNDVDFSAATTSIGATPVAGNTTATVSGFVQRIVASAAGTTTGTIAIAVSINNGSDITGGGLTIAAGSNPRAGSVMEFAMNGASSGVFVNEGDNIVFTPSGGGGASIPGSFALVVRSIT